MNNTFTDKRNDSFGQSKLSFIDKIGVRLSFVQIRKYLQKYSTPLNLLDLGCGYNASLITQLLPQFQHAVGVDVRINDFLKQNPKMPFYETTIEKYIQESNSEQFDIILLISVLEHLCSPENILNYCQKSLNSNGLLIINVPTWRGKIFLELSAFKLGLSPVLEMNDHKMYYDIRDLWPLLVKGGFKPREIEMKYHKFGLNLFAVIKKGGN